MIIKKIAFAVALSGSTLYGIQYMTNNSVAQKRVVADNEIEVIYVYQSTRCPRVEGLFKELEKENLPNSIFMIVQSNKAQKLFDITITRVPIILFVKNGVVVSTMESPITQDAIKSRLALL